MAPSRPAIKADESLGDSLGPECDPAPDRNRRRANNCCHKSVLSWALLSGTGGGLEGFALASSVIRFYFQSKIFSKMVR